MDLLAFATVDNGTHVHRLNGQKVFGIQSKQGSSKACKIKWKPDGKAACFRNLYVFAHLMLGQLLATASGDHCLTLTNAHTGKTVHKLDCAQYSQSEVSCLGWGVNVTETKKLNEQFASLRGSLDLEGVNDTPPQMKTADSNPDLPLDLAFLDVESSLPKLSPLAAGGFEYVHVIRSRANMD